MTRLRVGAVVGMGLCGAAQAASTLTVCVEAPPETFDMAQAQLSLTMNTVGATIYESLLETAPGTVDLRPALASAVDISPDGLQYTLHLRPGVKFHTTAWFKPTREMNADDVMFSIQRQMDPKSPWRAMAKGGFANWSSSAGEVVTAVEKIDPMTVRITLRQPHAPMQSLLSWSAVMSVFSAEYGAALLKSGRLEQLARQPVGTGPWQFSNYQKDAVLRLAAHPGYWRGAQKIDHLVYAITPDTNVREQRLKAGECLVGSNLRANSIAALAGAPVDVLATPVLKRDYVPLNTQRPFLSDRRFRQALWLGLDKQTLIASVYGGRARAATSPLPSTQWGFDDTLVDRHDVERAAAEVKASGYDGRELEILVRIGGSVDSKRAAELMQADWARIGVKTRIRQIEYAELIKRGGQGQYDIALISYYGGGDPDDFFFTTLTCAAKTSGTNESQWCNKELDEAVGAARRTVDRTARIALYRKAQRIVYDEVPLIPLADPQYFMAVNRKVKGFVTGPGADMDFRGVSVDAR